MERRERKKEQKKQRISTTVGRREGGKCKDALLNIPYLITKTTKGGGGEGGKEFPILRQHSLWMAFNRLSQKDCLI